MTTGKITTPSGREFAFPDMERYSSGKVSNFTQIKNYPVQSFATADIVPVVLLEIDQRLADCKSCIVNTVHDSIVVDVHPDEEVKVLSIIRNINDYIDGLIQLQFGVTVNVPLLLESKIGDNWLDTKDVA
jgi:DNA polymerase-1